MRGSLERQDITLYTLARSVDAGDLNVHVLARGQGRQLMRPCKGIRDVNFVLGASLAYVDVEAEHRD